MVRKENIEKDRVRGELMKLLKPGDTLYTKVEHVSRSGMSRDISVYIFRDNQPMMINYDVSIMTGYPLSKKEGVKIGGCGMDMGFALVYALSRELFGEGYDCIGDKCPSAYHVNRRDPNAPVETIHKDGYALKQRWL